MQNIDAAKWEALKTKAQEGLAKELERWATIADTLDTVTADITISVRFGGYGEFKDSLTFQSVELFPDDAVEDEGVDEPND